MSGLSDDQTTYLDQELYPTSLERSGQSDTPLNRVLAASAYHQFLTLGGSSDDRAIDEIVAQLSARPVAG
jgi:hypothetical protein